MKHYAIVVGARPNLVKAAALFAGVAERSDVRCTLLHTGQHHDERMSQVFFEQFGLPTPAMQLSVSSVSLNGYGERLGRMVEGLYTALSNLEDLSGVIVIGDVDSTLAGALATVRLGGVPLIHVEAGLRSFDRRMPEETNRIIVDHLSDVLFTTESSGKENLIREGIAPEKIFFVGNLMIESLERFKDKTAECRMPERLGLERGGYFVVTIHRQEHTSDKSLLKKILSVLESLAERTPLVMPLHPSTRKKLEEYNMLGILNKIITTEPLGYFEFMDLLAGSRGAITDSGGVQEETSYLRIPCGTLRDSTERPVTISLGTNKLFPSAELGDHSAGAIEMHLTTPNTGQPVPLWDMQVSKRIFDILR